MSVVVDTNVLVVANGRHEAASLQCEHACIEALADARRGRTLVDSGQRVFDEYRRLCSHSGQPGAGNAFFKWLWDNQANPDHCEQVPITPHPVRLFEEFPDDLALAEFDRSDRKFVAISLASGRAVPILNASDTDWWAHRDALETHGVQVTFLCPDLMEGP